MLSLLTLSEGLLPFVDSASLLDIEVASLSCALWFVGSTTMSNRLQHFDHLFPFMVVCNYSHNCLMKCNSCMQLRYTVALTACCKPLKDCPDSAAEQNNNATQRQCQHFNYVSEPRLGGSGVSLQPTKVVRLSGLSGLVL